jgi:NADPH-dependent F420 reductase
MRVAVVGGTGDFGLALAQQLVAAGDDVMIGSRDAERARAKAAEIGARGDENARAAADADLVVLAVKAEAAIATAEALADALEGKSVLSVASELRFTKQGVFPTDHPRSIAERIAEIVPGPVAAGLHSLAASSLADGPADGDALVCGDDDAAKRLALELAGKIVRGRAIDAGPLTVARALEAMTAVLLNVNRAYKTHAGLRFTGIP